MSAYVAVKPFAGAVHRVWVKASPSLLLSDYVFLAGLWAALLFVYDPFDWRLERQFLSKHLPAMVALGGVLLVWIGNALFARSPIGRPEPRWRVISGAFPLFVLAVWIAAGSWYARNTLGINNTFMIVGVYMLFTLLAARVVLLSPARERLVQAYLRGALLVCALMYLRILTYWVIGGEGDVPYHEMEALVIPAAVYFAMRPEARWNGALLVFFLLGGLLFRKNTAYLVIMLTGVYLWVFHWRFRFRESPVFRQWTFVIGFGGAMALVAAVVYLAYPWGEAMPSGNPQYRLLTYEQAWRRFLDSPIWGTAFAASGTEKFTGFDIAAAKGVLPTHSDVLDLAANGGVIALVLWLWGYLRIARLAWRHLLRKRERSELLAVAHTLACMNLCGILVYIFNPIMLQPAKALILWTSMGLLLGLSLYCARQAGNEEAKKL